MPDSSPFSSKPNSPAGVFRKTAVRLSASLPIRLKNPLATTPHPCQGGFSLGNSGAAAPSVTLRSDSGKNASLREKPCIFPFLRQRAPWAFPRVFHRFFHRIHSFPQRARPFCPFLWVRLWIMWITFEKPSSVFHNRPDAGLMHPLLFFFPEKELLHFLRCA